MNKTPKRPSYDDLNNDTYPIANNKHTRNANRKFLRLVVLLLAACLSLGMIYLLRSGPFSKKVDRKQDLWGYLSPYRVIQEYKNPPPECTIDQVNILHRHGARFPELADQQATKAAVEKYQRAKGYLAPEIQFLSNYLYDLGSESLVQLGAEQSWVSGADAYGRYAALVDRVHMPFIRASLSDRVVMSARNWSAGFYESSRRLYQPQVSVLVHEGPQFNNTLHNENCPEALKGEKQSEQWIEVYAEHIARRLNSAAAGLQENMTAKDAFYLMMMCPFETVYRREYSPFCMMFSEEEFEGFEYALDLEQYYTTGYGQVQDLGRIQGVGYVNELLARLTKKPVKDNTQTNHTLDDNPKTFPLGERMYADFSHDHEMAAIYSAIGLFNTSRLNPYKMNRNRSWVASDIMPFSAKMLVEKLQCNARTPGRLYRSSSARRGEREGEYIRILVNDVVQPLDFCGGDKDGLCELRKFIESQSYARSDGDGNFPKCGYP